jgi:kynurenine formamidase
LACFLLVSCDEDAAESPEKIVDLSPTITEDLPVRVVGHALLSGIGARDSTEFEHIEGDGSLYYLDSYITLFNHAGPHADAPLHLIPDGKAIDQLELANFFGPAQVLDYRSLARTDKVPISELQKHNIQAGDIIILYVGYEVPTDPEELPVYPVLSPAAAEYLAELPVRAFATDVPGVDDVLRLMDLWEQGVTGLANLLPVHHAFLSREIPVIEQLVNLDAIVGEEDVVFVGFPVKLTGKAGDAGVMRAAALVY